jgi:ribosomal protein S6
MAIDTSVSPYFDDYTEDKNFHKVLFKPGVAVQSRELNQTQTILQNQIKRVGDYLFTDGQKVTGVKPSVNLDARTVRLLDRNTSGNTIAISDFLGKYVTSENSNIIGYVEFVFEKDDPNIGDLPSIVISLKKFNTTDNGIFAQQDVLYFYDSISDALNKLTSTLTAVVEADIVKNATSIVTPFSKSIILTNPTDLIEVGDLLVHPRITKQVYVTEVKSSLEVIVDVAPGATIDEENIQYIKQGTCPTSIVTQDVTYFYRNGYLIRSNLQKIVPDKNTGSPSKVIGLFVNEQIITSSDDASLLDPAVGSSNYFAPGADRLKFDLSIASFDLSPNLTADTTENIIPLLTINKGEIEYVSDTGIESELRKEIEQRTYDESGNYVVNEFIITPVSTTDQDTNLKINVSGGKAYVGGREVTTISTTEINIPRPVNTETKTGYNITTTQGNYMRIKDLNFIGGSNMIIPKADNITQGEIYLEMHSIPNPTTSATKVGEVVFKNIEYDSSLGTGTQFKLFYHNFSTVQDAPATWEAWSAKYGISVADGQFIANTFFSSPTASTLLGNYGVANTPSYALYREPEVDEVAYWYRQWVADGRDIAITKRKFAESILSNSLSSDYTRLTTTTKAFSQVLNGSPFADGLINAKQVKSIVGVANAKTNHLTSASYGQPFFYANIAAAGLDARNNLTIIDPRSSDALVFKVGSKEFIKSITNIRTTYSRVIRNAVFTNGIFTKSLLYPESFPQGDGVVVASTARTNFIISVKSGATASVGNGVFNFSQGSVTISSDSSIATINLGDNTFNGIADIEFLVQSDNLTPRTKTLVKDAYQFVNVTNAEIEYNLKISDIAKHHGAYKLINNNKFKGSWLSNVSYDYNEVVIKDGSIYNAIRPSSNVSVLETNNWSRLQVVSNDFILSDGQRDGWYDHGSVKFVGATSQIPGNVLVAYDYFTHTGDGPCTADSYPETYYREIPTYKSVVDSKEYNLVDCLDFRPKRINGSDYLNFETAVFPVSYVNTDADVTYYLARTDILYVSKDNINFDSPYNRLYVETGVNSSGLFVQDDPIVKSRLAIATLQIPPFAESAFEIDIVYRDNQRFTMQDIAKIERTTIALDKAIRVQAIEIANLKSIIVNDNGDTLLKSGILVENFTDFSKADIENPNYSIAISPSEGVCEPLFTAHNLNLEIVSASNFNLADGIITAKYTNEVFISQVEANSFVNPNPGGIDDRRGRAYISKRNTYSLNLLEWGLVGVGLYVAGSAAFAGVTAAFAAGASLASIGVAAGAAWTAAQAAIFNVGVVLEAGASLILGGIAATNTFFVATLGFPPLLAGIATVIVVVAVAAVILEGAKDVVKWVDKKVGQAKRWWKKTFSDNRMKKNVKFIRKIKPGLNLYKFEYKKPFKKLTGAGYGTFYGLMAQEVEKIYPKAVITENNGYKSINYSLIGI